MTDPALPSGRVLRVRGSVIDVEFAQGDPPLLYEGLEVISEGAESLVLEVQQYLDARTVRTVVMQVASGLRRGAFVRRTGGPLTMPVGKELLGRLVNVLGRPTDGGSPFGAEIRRMPIHRAAPPFQEQGARREPLLTGIKVIDLLAPLARGGKAGMFGGAGVGKTVLIMELIRTTVSRHSGCLYSLAWVSDRAAIQRRAQYELLVVGSRSVLRATERRERVSWSSAMATQVGGIDEVALRIAERLGQVAEHGDIGKVILVYTRSSGGPTWRIVTETLLPFDVRLYLLTRMDRPLALSNLRPGPLLDGLITELLFAQLAHAATESFASENAGPARFDGIRRRQRHCQARRPLRHRAGATSRGDHD